MKLSDLNPKDIEVVSKEERKSSGLKLSDLQADEIEQISKTESGLRGAAQGVSMGYADEITGGAKGFIEDMKNLFSGSEETNAPAAQYDEFGRVVNPEELQGSYKKHRDVARDAYKAAQEANPDTYLAGEIGGGIASAFIPGINVAKGAGFAGVVGKSALQGAITGSGLSEADTVEGLAKDTLIGGAVGGAAGTAGELVKAGGRFIGNSNLGSKINKGLAKTSSLLSGVDEEAALRQIQRPAQTAAAEGDDFVFNLGQKAVGEAENLKEELGKNINKAGLEFQKRHGEVTFSTKSLSDKIDDFLVTNKPSAKGFSSLNPKQAGTLQNLSDGLKMGETTGEDLYKLRQYLDNVEKLAGKYDKEGTSPFVNFLKGLRHDADQIVDEFDPNLDSANRAYSKFKENTGILRSATNESQAEGMIGNLYGANKKAKQEAASQLFSADTMEAAKDIAANKSFDAAKSPGGDNYFRRGALAVLTSGVSEAATSPWVNKNVLRGVGRFQQILETNPAYFGKFSSALQAAATRGNTSLAATDFILQQQHPEYRQMKKQLDDEETNE